MVHGSTPRSLHISSQITWGRPAFLLGKLFERVNVSAANALDEFDYQLTLLPLVDLIKVFHFALSLTFGRLPLVGFGRRPFFARRNRLRRFGVPLPSELLPPARVARPFNDAASSLESSIKERSMQRGGAAKELSS